MILTHTWRLKQLVGGSWPAALGTVVRWDAGKDISELHPPENPRNILDAAIKRGNLREGIVLIESEYIHPAIQPHREHHLLRVRKPAEPALEIVNVE